MSFHARIVLLIALLFGATLPAEAATRNTFEGFEGANVPPEWSVTTPSRTTFLGIAKGGDLRYEGKQALSWTFTDGALRYTAPAHFDHVDFHVRQAPYTSTSGCLRVAAGNRVTHVDFPPTSTWKHVTLDSAATNVLTLSSCSQSSGTFLIDAVVTYVREQEASLDLAKDDALVRLQDNNRTPSLVIGTPQLPPPIVVLPPDSEETVHVGMRYNKSYGSEPMGPVRFPVTPGTYNQWTQSGTGMSVSLSGRQIVFIPYVGQAWVILV